MTFTLAVKRGFEQYVVWRGRASRAEYWWFTLFALMCYVVTVVLTVVLEFPLIGLAYFGLLLPTLSVGIRRLHDTNLNGWWWWISLHPLGFIALIVLFCTPSEPWPNKFGPPPSPPVAR